MGSAVPCGWILHDVLVYLHSGQPGLALELLPPSLPALLLGCLVAAAAARSRLLLLPLLLLEGGAVLYLATRAHGFGPRALWLALAVLSLTAGVAVASAWRWPRPGVARLGFFAGFLACVLVTRQRGLVGLDVEILAGLLGILGAGWLARPGQRWTATALLALLLTARVGSEALPATLPSRADLPPPTATAPANAPDLLLIVLDTVRADHLAPYGYGRVTTPGLDRFVDDHFTRYTDARATSSWTLPSHASMFTGLFPAEHGSVHAGRFGQPMDPEAPTLAELLRARGYRTGAIMSNNVYLRAGRYGLERGFEHYDDRLASKVGRYWPLVQLAGRNERPGHLGYRDAREITDLALDWLADQPAGEPVFLVLNYMDAHTPHIPVAHVDVREVREESAPRAPVRPLAAAYDRDLVYLDEHLTRLLDDLETSGRFEDTAILITSDHGESLGEHGHAGHGWILYESVLRVPLYVKPAGGRASVLSEAPVTSVDTFHLALELTGWESAAARRSPLLSGIVGELHVHPGESAKTKENTGPEARDSSDLLTWLEGTHKVIASTQGGLEVFDLERDPDELHPLELTPVREEELRRKARAWWLEHPIRSAEPVEIGEDMLERMRALGY